MKALKVAGMFIACYFFSWAATAEPHGRLLAVRDPDNPAQFVHSAEAGAIVERSLREGRLRLIVRLTSDVTVQKALALGPTAGPLALAEAALSAQRSFEERFALHIGGDSSYYYTPVSGLPYVQIAVDAPGARALFLDSEVLSVNTEGGGSVFLNASLPFINADDAHTAGYTGSGYTIAVLDTGVDSSHDMFSGRTVSEACFSTPDPTYGDLCAPGFSDGSTASGSGGPCEVPGSLGADCNQGHGSHVAAIAMGKSVTPGGGIPSLYGTAKNADLIAMQVKAVTSSSSICDPGASPCLRFLEGDLADALMRIHELRNSFEIAAVNLSFGLSLNHNEWSNTHCDASWPVVYDAVQMLNLSRIAVVAASGNSGLIPNYRNKLPPPACLSNVVSVAATHKNVATFASYSNAGTYLDLLAPGGNDITHSTAACGFPQTYLDGIWSAFPFAGCDYLRLPGTSMAAPHVAGAYAVLHDRYPGASASGVLDLLVAAGVSIPFTQHATGYTKPLIDLSAALTAPVAPTGAPATMNFSTVCDSTWHVGWSPVAGTVTEYQLEGSGSSSFANSELWYVGVAASTEVTVPGPRYFRARACNTVSCGPWKSGPNAIGTYSGCP